MSAMPFFPPQRSTAPGRLTRLVSISLLSILAACADSAPSMPPPEGARALPATGDHEVRTDLAVAGIYDGYGPHFGNMRATSYLLPEDASWSVVEAHYARMLQDWEADGRFPARTGRTSARTWVRGDKVVVVELFDAGRSRVLVVATNEPAS